MSARFNPPPNWPPPPVGWTPPSGWQPDPRWGPPPAGWQLWVADQAAQKPWYGRWWAIASAGVVGLIFVAGVVGAAGGTTDQTSAAGPVATEATDPTETRAIPPSRQPTPSTVEPPSP